MTDGQPDPASKGQPDQASPEVAELKATLAVLTKQLEETKQLASEKDKAHHAATSKMNEALNRLDTLQKEAERQKLELSDEDAAKLADNPKDLVQYTLNQNREELKREIDGLRADQRVLAEEMAKAIVERDRATESAIKGLDPRFQTAAFKAKKEQYGEHFTDEQIMQIVELDGAPKPPPPPAGTTAVPTASPEPEEHVKKAVSEIFGETIKRYEKEAK